MEPTTGELARDLRQLEQRVERERAELLEELRRGFSELRLAIEAQSSERITKDVYRADQRRYETEIGQLRRDVASMRRVFVSGFLTVIAASVVVQMIMG